MNGAESVELYKEEIDEFTNLEKTIKQLRNKIKPYQDQIKDLTKKKKELEIEICNVLCKNTVTQIQLSEQKVSLEYKVNNSLVPLTQAYIKERMLDFFETGPASKISFNSLSNADKGNVLVDYIYNKENRNTVVKEQIKMKDYVPSDDEAD